MKKLFRSMLLLGLVALLTSAGCYYQMNDDGAPEDPTGTGVQGYALHVMVQPSTIPANGAQTVITARLRRLEDGSAVTGIPIYLSLWTKTLDPESDPENPEYFTNPCPGYYAKLENGVSRMEKTTDGLGVAKIHAISADAWEYRSEWNIDTRVDHSLWLSEVNLVVRAEVSVDYPENFIYVSDETLLNIYNPYL